MNLLSLPLSQEQYQSLNKQQDIIDMSQLNFAVEDKIRAAFIYFRNMGMDVNITFKYCPYEVKEQWLVKYMTTDISCTIPFIMTTWFEILMSEITDEPRYPSFLDQDEIKQFKERNQELMNKINQLIISLPVGAIKYFMLSMDDLREDYEFPTTDEASINFTNFIQLTGLEDFILLIRPIEGIEPKDFVNYFNKDNHQFGFITQNLPYLMMMNVFMSGNESVYNDTVANISKIYAERMAESNAKPE